MTEHEENLEEQIRDLEEEIRGNEYARRSAGGLAVLIATGVESISADLDCIDSGDDALRVAAELLIDRLERAEETFEAAYYLAKRYGRPKREATTTEATAN